MQHARNTNIVDVATITKCKRLGFVLDRTCADASWINQYGYFAARNHLNRVKDLDVSGTTTQVRTEMLGHIASLQRSTLFVDLSLGSHNNARNTKTTLQTATCRECLRVAIAFFFVDTFKGRDGSTCNFGEWCLTTDYCFAIDPHCATTTLTRRRTSIFWRCDVQFFSQCRQQMGVIGPHSYGSCVDSESDAKVVLGAQIHSSHGFYATAIALQNVKQWPTIWINREPHLVDQ